MKIKKAIILGAGFGKRMHPITKKIPKPLVKINNITLLENSINFLNSIGVKHIVINTHFRHKQISDFIRKKKFSSKIDLIIEKRKILNTGGGILNASKIFIKQIFFVLNPDTLWRKGYKNEFRKSPHSRSIEGIKNLSKIRGNLCQMTFCQPLVSEI